MGKRSKNRKRRGPGVYQNQDGSVTTVEFLDDGRIVETIVHNPGTARQWKMKSTLSQESQSKVDRGENLKEMARQQKAPVARCNPVPGMPDRIKKDPLTGLELSDPAQYKRALKENGWRELDSKKDPIRQPDHTEVPKREPFVYTHGHIKAIQFTGDDSFETVELNDVVGARQREYANSYKFQRRQRISKDKIKRKLKEKHQ